MLSDGFGPWIEHDGSGMPVLHGTVVQAKCECVTGKVVCVTKIAGETSGAAWNWRNFGKTTVWRALSYRIRKPRGLTILEGLISDAPELVSA